MNNEILLEKTSSALIGTYDFKDLAKKASEILVKELPSEEIIGVAVFRVDPNRNLLQAYHYSTRFRRTIEKLLIKDFSELSLPLTYTDNLCIKTVITNQPQQSIKLSDFGQGVLPEILIDKIQKIMKARLMISFPIRLKSGRCAGMALFVLGTSNIDPKLFTLCETFANQLGLAFSNVFAFEKLLNQYRIATDKKSPDRKNVPDIKFTLRITANENNLLEQLSKQQSKTKAEIIRSLIDQQSL